MKDTSDDPHRSGVPQAFDHLTLVVSDLVRSRTFYGVWLGLREVPRPAFDFPGLWFQLGSVQLHLIQNPERPPSEPSGERVSRGPHFALEVADLPAALDRWNALGGELAQGPQQRPDGAQQVFLFDPDGHVVELFARGDEPDSRDPALEDFRDRGPA